MKDEQEKQFAVLLLSTKDNLQPYNAHDSFVPSVNTKIDEIKSYFTDIISLHKYSPEVRKIIWSSVAIVFILVVIVITIVTILCCPSCCSCCDNCRRPSGPPPYEPGDRSIPLLQRADAPPAEE